MSHPVRFLVHFENADQMTQVRFIEGNNQAAHGISTSSDSKERLSQIKELAAAIQHLASKLCGSHLSITASDKTGYWDWDPKKLLCIAIEGEPKCNPLFFTDVTCAFSLVMARQARGTLPTSTAVSATIMDSQALSQIINSLNQPKNAVNAPLSEPISATPIAPPPKEAPSLVKGSKLCGAAEWFIQGMELLNEQERGVIRNCISKYAKPKSLPDFLRWILFRVSNAIKSLFGKSDWEVAKRTIADRRLQAALEKQSTVVDPQDPRKLSARSKLQAEMDLSISLRFQNQGQKECK